MLHLQTYIYKQKYKTKYFIMYKDYPRCKNRITLQV